MMKTQGRYTFIFVPDNGAKDVSARIFLRLPQEQANTISKIKQNEIGF